MEYAAACYADGVCGSVGELQRNDRPAEASAHSCGDPERTSQLRPVSCLVTAASNWTEEEDSSCLRLKIGLGVRCHPSSAHGTIHSADTLSCAQRPLNTLAKGKATPVAPVVYRCGAPLLLRLFEGEPGVLDQIVSLEKKVFAKKSSWTGQCQCNVAFAPLTGSRSNSARRRLEDRSRTSQYLPLLHCARRF